MDPLSIIAGIIAIVDSILKTYNTIRDVQGLPKAFEEVAQNLPLVKETLEITLQQAQQNTPDEAEKRAIEPIIKGCQDKVEALNNIFQKIQKKKEQNDGAKDWSTLSKFYHNVVVPMGKAHRVETLMGDMMNKLKVLAIHQIFKAATQTQIEKLEEAINELSQVEPSLPDSDFETSGNNVTQTINDRGSGAVCTGGSMENNWGNMFKADRDMNLAEYHIYRSTSSYSDVGAVILDWLESIATPLHFDEKLHELSQVAEKSPGSGSWFLRFPQLNEWINGGLQKLWCYGIAGAGKSVITSIVINHLQNLPNRYYGPHNTACIYVYFDYREHKSQTLTNVLSSLLVQLLRTSHKVAPELEERYETCRKKGRFPTADAYLRMLISQAEKFRRIYMVADALDECCGDTDTNMLSEFLQVCRGLPETFHILFTSRPGLNSQLAEPGFEFQITAQPEDIRSYLDMFIASRPSMLAIVEEGLSYNPLFREFILNTLVNGSQGMFLLAHLHIGNLASTHTLEEFEEALTQLSGNLVEVYQAALDRISAQPEKQRKTAMNLLTWIVFAKRPLTVIEATQVLAIQNASSEPQSSKAVIPKASATIETEWALTSVCAGMVVGVADKNTTFLHLAHSSAEQHLKKSLLSRSQDAHSTLTEVCLRCLVNTPAPEHLRQRPSSQDIADHFKKNYPFFHYAANHWGEHLAYQAKGPAKRLAWDFLSDKERLGYAVLAMGDPKVSREEKVTGLHIAAYFGLTNLVKKAISFQRQLDINSCTKRSETPLHWAVTHGQTEFAEFLVTQHADLNIPSSDKRTPLHLAIINDDVALVSLFLSTGRADPDLRDCKGFTPLIVAVTKGKVRIVEMLLKHGAKADSKDNDGWTALRWAAQLGYKLIIKLLIRYEASVSSPTRDGWTLLRWAASEGRADIISLLSEMRINLNATDSDGITALRWAVNYNCSMAAWALLQARADVNKPDNNGTTPLHVAAERYHLSSKSNDILWLLLVNGASVNAQTEGFMLTPLHLAASGGSESAIWLLLSKGADPNKVDANERTALHCAVASEHIKATQLLLWKTTGFVNAVDHENRTVLHYAASQGNVAIAEMLVGWGADINARDRSGQTPLHIAVLQGHENVAVYLVRAGANLEVPCKKNRVRVSLDDLVSSMESTTIKEAIDQARGIGRAV